MPLDYHSGFNTGGGNDGMMLQNMWLARREAEMRQLQMQQAAQRLLMEKQQLDTEREKLGFEKQKYEAGAPSRAAEALYNTESANKARAEVASMQQKSDLASRLGDQVRYSAQPKDVPTIDLPIMGRVPYFGQDYNDKWNNADIQGSLASVAAQSPQNIMQQEAERRMLSEPGGPENVALGREKSQLGALGNIYGMLTKNAQGIIPTAGSTAAAADLEALRPLIIDAVNKALGRGTNAPGVAPNPATQGLGVGQTVQDGDIKITRTQ